MKQIHGRDMYGLGVYVCPEFCIPFLYAFTPVDMVSYNEFRDVEILAFLVLGVSVWPPNNFQGEVHTLNVELKEKIPVHSYYKLLYTILYIRVYGLPGCVIILT